jgi:uncharacterized membrane protein
MEESNRHNPLFKLEKNMTIAINRSADIAKFIAFLAAKAKSNFVVAPDVAAELVKKVQEWAKKNHVTVNFTTPSSAKLTACMAFGATAGMVFGLAIPPVGVVTGAVVGALGGFAIAHMTIEIIPAGPDGKVGVKLC